MKLLLARCFLFKNLEFEGPFFGAIGIALNWEQHAIHPFFYCAVPRGYTGVLRGVLLLSPRLFVDNHDSFAYEPAFPKKKRSGGFENCSGLRGKKYESQPPPISGGQRLVAQ
jgi:hypothetical protein